MSLNNTIHVRKACAYITRNESELLVFEGPEHDGLQIPKGTVKSRESPREAVHREIVEESGLATFGRMRHLVTDVWNRRESPPKRYVRSFYHSSVHHPRDRWTHTVTGKGEEQGNQFEFFWVDLQSDRRFALDLDDYVELLPKAADKKTSQGLASD